MSSDYSDDLQRKRINIKFKFHISPFYSDESMLWELMGGETLSLGMHRQGQKLLCYTTAGHATPNEPGDVICTYR